MSLSERIEILFEELECQIRTEYDGTPFLRCEESKALLKQTAIDLLKEAGSIAQYAVFFNAPLRNGMPTTQKTMDAVFAAIMGLADK